MCFVSVFENDDYKQIDALVVCNEISWDWPCVMRVVGS